MRPVYRLLSLDMDGTLLTPDKRILPGTLTALNAAIDRGAVVTLCTGRAVAELDVYRQALAKVPYAIINSGALVVRLPDGKVLCKRAFDEGTVRNILRAGREEDAMPYLMTERESLADARQKRDMSVYRLSAYQSLYDRVCRGVPDIRAAAAENSGEILKICLYHRTPEARSRTRRRLAGEDVQLADFEETSLEISPAGVTKAAGLRFLARQLGISMAETVAVGDSDNDRSVLEAAGLAVAMGNASPEIKAICGAVVADNAHDGVAEAIKRFF